MIEDDKPVCDIYWGSHGCKYRHGHDGPHICSCCEDPSGHTDAGHDPDCVGAPPYYGPETRFYGDDVPEGWLLAKEWFSWWVG